MKNISIKGILLACLVTFVLDIVCGIVLTLLLAKDMSEESLKAVGQETSMLLYSLFIGTITTVLGGIIAAKYGKSAPYKNAAVVGIIGVVVGVLLCGNNPLWFNVIAFLTTIPASLLGAFFVLRKKEQRV